ncbi:MAG TPA: amidohydrolase family protein [Streptosporangiaceae bacterium]|nr:amidohydrolase family protein [Streptosporangiaceae bacterium]
MATDTGAGRLRDLPLRDYRPRSQMIMAEHQVPAAAVPAIDAHAHLGRWLSPDGSWMAPDVARLVAEMDQCNITGIVNLDGRWGAELAANLARYDHAYPGRFATCCHLDWRELSEPGFGDRLAAGLRASAAAGAAGVKVWKDLGLHLRDDRGELVLPGDGRLAPVWAVAGELGLPIFIHTADPVAFFDPVDERNERLEQLLSRPDWSFAGPGFPSFAQLMDSLEELVAAHPQTTFVGVHVGCYAENLGWVSRMLDSYPNFYVDTAARIAELGRQPRATAGLIARHPGRVLFGTDEIPFDTRVYAIYFRFLQTLDESFDHCLEDPPPMGRWKISGLGLAPGVLRQVYAANAGQLVPRLRQ